MTARPVSLADQLASARRELAMRRGAYPKWIAAGRLTAAKAQAEIAAMTAIVETLVGAERRAQLLAKAADMIKREALYLDDDNEALLEAIAAEIGEKL